jgi:peroxiredoxin
MSRANCAILDTGDVFPAMQFRVIGDESVSLPVDIRGKWAVLLFYRGHW